MIKLLFIALAVTGITQAQQEYPHPKTFTQTQIDRMSNGYLNGLRRAYPDYIISRSWQVQEPTVHYTAKQLAAMEAEDERIRKKLLAQDNEDNEERPVYYNALSAEDKKKFDTKDFAHMDYFNKNKK